MKPEGAIELSVSADLSECSYEAAKEMASMALQDKDNDSYKLKNTEISVSLWDIDTAIYVMTRFRDCNVKINRFYSNGEWSVRVYTRKAESVVWDSG